MLPGISQGWESVTLVRNTVFDRVRGEILTCALQPGEELREQELARRYGVSKSPVRDALQKLEFEGLVEIEPRRGHRVKPISVSDTEDILDLRVLLESGIVRRTAERASDEALATLDAFREADTNSVPAFAAYNREFHTCLSRLSGNRRLADEMRRVMEFYDRLCVVSLRNQRSKDCSEPLADHVAIIEALQARNGAAAARLMARHVGRSRAALLRGLGQRPIVE